MLTMETQTTLTQAFNQLSKKAKIEIFCFIAFLLFTFIAMFYLTLSYKNSKEDVHSLQVLDRQKKILEDNNLILIKTVADLNGIISRSQSRDSIVGVLVQEQNNMIPQINNKLNSIDEHYKNLANVNNFSSDEIRSYISTEAIRIRNLPPER